MQLMVNNWLTSKINLKQTALCEFEIRSILTGFIVISSLLLSLFT